MEAEKGRGMILYSRHPKRKIQYNGPGWCHRPCMINDLFIHNVRPTYLSNLTQRVDVREVGLVGVRMTKYINFRCQNQTLS